MYRALNPRSLTVNYAKLRDADSPDTLFPLLEPYWS